MNFRGGDILIFSVFFTDRSTPAVAFDASISVVDIVRMEDDGTETQVVTAQAAIKSTVITGLQYFLFTAPASGNASALTARFTTASPEVSAADLTSGVSVLYPAEQNMDVPVSTRCVDSNGKVIVQVPLETPSHIEIRVGDDYFIVFQRQFQWLFQNRPELVGGVANLSIDGIRIADGSVIDSGVDDDGNTLQTVQIEVDSTESILLIGHEGLRKPFSVQITKDSELMVEIQGTADVQVQHPQ